jgi:hypothetical protein
MRDDRYRGPSLPRLMRKLCRMAEREADRANPERLRQHAIVALVSDVQREISPEFRQRLREHDAAPRPFGANEFIESVRTGLETEIARNIGATRSVKPTDAICEALRRRAEGYAREQRCQLIADRDPIASLASESFKKACTDGALIAAGLILHNRPAPTHSIRVSPSENLLAQANSGAIDPDRYAMAEQNIRQLLRRHKSEWDGFMSSLPERSWVREIAGQL